MILKLSLINDSPVSCCLINFDYKLQCHEVPLVGATSFESNEIIFVQ